MFARVVPRHRVPRHPRRFPTIKLLTVLVGGVPGVVAGGTAPSDVAVWGIEVPTEDRDRAARFYTEALDFRVMAEASDHSATLLMNGPVGLVIRKVARVSSDPELAGVHVNYAVADLQPAVERAVKLGASVRGEYPVRFALGTMAAMADPDGNRFHLVQLDELRPGASDRPSVFNIAVSADDVTAAERFYTEHLGFTVFSRDFLPATLPLNRRGTAPLVIHDRDRRAVSSDDAGYRPLLLLTTADVSATLAALNAAGVPTLEAPSALPPGRTVLVRDPAGIRHRIVRAGAVTGFTATSSAPPRIADVAWIAGRWQLEQGEGVLEEVWSEPSGDCMMGMFRWLKNGKVWIYELLTIREEEDSLVFRFRHFDKGLTAWEPKEAPLTYRLKSVGPDEVVFQDSSNAKRYIFRRTGPDSMLVRLEEETDGRIGADDFAYHRP